MLRLQKADPDKQMVEETERCCVSAFRKPYRCVFFRHTYRRPMHVVNRNTSGLYWSVSRLWLWLCLCLCGGETVGVTPGHAEAACCYVCVCVLKGWLGVCRGGVLEPVLLLRYVCPEGTLPTLYSLSATRRRIGSCEA